MKAIIKANHMKGAKAEIESAKTTIYTVNDTPSCRWRQNNKSKMGNRKLAFR